MAALGKGGIPPYIPPEELLNPARSSKFDGPAGGGGPKAPRRAHPEKIRISADAEEKQLAFLRRQLAAGRELTEPQRVLLEKLGYTEDELLDGGDSRIAAPIHKELGLVPRGRSKSRERRADGSEATRGSSKGKAGAGAGSSSGSSSMRKARSKSRGKH